MKALAISIGSVAFLSTLVPGVRQGVFAQIGICPASPRCGIQDSSPPPLLSGFGGHGNDYKFAWTADANYVGQGKTRISRYEHAIHNQHQDRLLDVEWVDGGIAFQRLNPDCCVKSLRESCIKPKEKPDSIILYGATKQFTTKASAYVPEAKTKILSMEEVHPLTSSLNGNFLWRKEPIVLDLEFRTEVKPDFEFLYTVTTNSSREVLYRIDALTSRWTQYGVLGKALTESKWQRATPNVDVFRLGVSRSATLTIKAPNTKEIIEEGADLRVYIDNPENEIARMTVSVHLPSALATR